MALDTYDAWADAAPKNAQAGAELSSDLVYYRCRKFSGPHLRRDEEGSLYSGKISRGALCLDVGGEPGQCISGIVIAYECRRKPGRELYQYSGTHKGSRGTFREDVYCKVEASFLRASV